MLPIAFTTTDIAAPSATNTAAVLTYAADGAGRSHVLAGVIADYDGTPTSGSIKVEDGAGRVVFGPMPITAAGPAPFYFPPSGRQGSPNTALIITVAAAGAVHGTATAIGHYTTSGRCLDALALYGSNNGVLDFSDRNNSEYLGLVL